jgi:hypothetical protein
MFIDQYIIYIKYGDGKYIIEKSRTIYLKELGKDETWKVHSL